MSEVEKAQLKKKMAERCAKFENMSNEEKAEMKKKFMEKRGKKD